MPPVPTKKQWEMLIRHMAAESGNILFTRHAEARMRERHITRLQVMEVLRNGLIKREPEPDMKTGDTQCRMEWLVAGRNIGAVVALKDQSASTGVVITALLIGG
jgi:hypothetical protein